MTVDEYIGKNGKSVKIGDVIMQNNRGKWKPIYIVQNNKNPHKQEEWQFFHIAYLPDKSRTPSIMDYYLIKEGQRIASEKERLAFLWDVEYKFSLVWDDSIGRMVKKPK